MHFVTDSTRATSSRCTSRSWTCATATSSATRRWRAADGVGHRPGGDAVRRGPRRRRSSTSSTGPAARRRSRAPAPPAWARRSRCSSTPTGARSRTTCPGDRARRPDVRPRRRPSGRWSSGPSRCCARSPSCARAAGASRSTTSARDSSSLALMPVLHADVIKLDLRLLRDRSPTTSPRSSPRSAPRPSSGWRPCSPRGSTPRSSSPRRARPGATLGQGYLLGEPTPAPPPAARARAARSAHRARGGAPENADPLPADDELAPADPRPARAGRAHGRPAVRAARARWASTG